MKKFVFALIIMVAFSTMTVFAGDIPESILGDDKALLFFGKVVSYNSANESLVVLPTQKIKGDVSIDKEETYSNIICFGAFTPLEGETYLMGFYDENNPLYILEVTSTDVSTLKVKDNAGGMGPRFQEYLNNGDYEQAESNRLLAKQEQPVEQMIEQTTEQTAEQTAGQTAERTAEQTAERMAEQTVEQLPTASQSPLKYKGYIYFVIIVLALAFSACYIFIKRKAKKKNESV
jgi:hypothetical protein